MARETLKDFLRSGRYPGPNENETGVVQYTLDSLVKESDGDSSGLAFEYNTGIPLVGFDAPDPNVGLVGNFLHYVTTEAGNFYEFKRGNQKTNAGNRGEVLQDQDKFLAVPPYIPQGTTEDSLLDQYSNSGYFNEPYPLEDIIDKVGGSRPSAPGARPANDLIKGVVNNDNDIVVRSSVEALKKKNRFNMEESKFVAPETGGIGGLDQKDNFQFVRNTEDFYTSFEKLKDAGASQLFKASGYDLSDNPENSTGFINNLEKMILDNIEGPAYETKVQMPGVVEGQEVDKISINRLKGMNASGVPTLENGLSVRSGRGVEVPVIPGSSNGGSFGVTYNHALRFEDNTKTHRIKTALRMISLFTLIESLYKEIIDNLSREDLVLIKDGIEKIAASPNTVNAGALALGLSRKSNKFIAKNFLFDNFLTPTDFPYSDCFYRGVKVMFGSDPKNADKTLENIDNVYNSPGFLLAISNVAIKKTFLFSDKIQRLQAIKEGSGVGFARQEAIKDILSEFGSVAKIANIFAIIGEKSLHYTNSSQEGSATSNVKNVRDVDSLDNIPGNRVGKSRKKKSGGRLGSGDLGSETTLAWEQSDIPSAYLLPLNIMRAAADLNNTYTRENPARGMLGSRMVRNTYTGLDTDGTSARIPARVVKILEDKLEAEYVPFYIQDLRTNEIISFHAFLSSLTDNITPSFSATAGYGRLDPVQTYQSTTRSISVGFTLYSTNREDFDDMWYKINKLVTLLYPQWTQGSIVQSGDPDSNLTIFKGYEGARFVQPFTQTIGASPIVRLRVGDVIKSNYSRFALARTFGIGDQGVKAQPIGYGGSVTASIFGEFMRKWRDLGLTIFATIFGSPQGLIQLGSDAVNAASSEKPGLNVGLNAGFDLASSALSDILINGFVNPLLTLQTMQRLRDPNIFDTEGFNGALSNIMFVYINPNMIDGYQSTEGIKIFTTKRLLGRVIETVNDETGNKKVYKVVITDRSDESIYKKEIFVKHEDIWNDPSETFTKSVAGILYLVSSGDFVSLVDTLSGILSKSGGDLAFLTDAASDIAQLFLENQESAFMRPELNPYVRSFHTTRGRGLAGVIKGINFNWLEKFPWETDFNARAPIGCDISFSFDVIHDIPPGLDHSGYNRAPLYNVGEIMRNVSGDVYEDKFSKGERIFRKGGSNTLTSGKTNKKTGRQ